MSTAPSRRGRKRIRAAVADLRLNLAGADAIVALSLLAVPAGLLTGLMIIAFRLLSERALVWAGLLPAVEHFEVLDWEWRFGLPAAGGLVIGLLFQIVPVAARQVGPVHVMARLALHGGRLPWRNALMQFVGGALSIVSGHSVGREGPVIHVGAASASLLGQWMRLPNNSIRTLVACGVAASIAASFNTPIAGVVFAMEVVMFEYTLAGFAPVILAAVSAATVSQAVFGADAAFAVPDFQLVSLLELPWVVLLGATIGCVASVYVYGIVKIEKQTQRVPIWLRMTLAGVFTGICALMVPEVMGLGYRTVEQAMLGQIALVALISIAATKLVATIACGGLGLPGGMIGPMVVIGATLGCALGIVGHELVPGYSAPPAFYATLGVVAMMGACLHAPLAALMAILELTGNPNTILPGMAAVITAYLISRVAFRRGPLFVAILHARGIDYRFDPVALALERTGVAAVMDRNYIIVDAGVDVADLNQLLLAKPNWVVVAEGGDIRGVWSAEAVAKLVAGDTQPSDTILRIDWLAEKSAFATVQLHSTLGEALAQLDRTGQHVALVSAAIVAQRHQLQGVLTRSQIESSVRYRT